MTCLGPSSDPTPDEIADLRRALDEGLPLALLHAVPDPHNYEQSPIGDGALRRDLQAWHDNAHAMLDGRKVSA